MNKEFQIVSINPNKNKDNLLINYNQQNANNVKKFHKSFPMYEVSPLVSLTNTAKYLNLSNIFIKDESQRFNLSSFKVLGSTYVIGKYFAKKLNMDISELSYELLNSKETHDKLGNITFIAATDGNHGRGIAWTAKQFGMNAIIFMPKGTASERLENIKKEGAEAEILDLNYDDTVRYAQQLAEKNNWIMVQDTAWENYEEIPTWIMQGYTTLALETYEQLPEIPTHIFLQAGVGSFSGALTAFFSLAYKDKLPTFTIIEPNNANCYFQTAKSINKEIVNIKGDLDTIMAGLACGEPNRIAWEIIREYVDHFITCPDYAAAKGMRILGNPVHGDKKIISGESGASAFGCIAEILTNPELKDIKDTLKINENSKLLFVSTEGDTDQKNYKDIVWDGKYPSY